MKKYDEIEDIIVNKLGYKDLASYQATHQSSAARNTPLSQEELTQLSPDNVDNREFWQVCNNLFGKDPVCNQQVPTSSIKKANFHNLQLSRFAGALGFAEGMLLHNPAASVLEVGVGFGNFKNWLEVQFPLSTYCGVDVAPQIDEIVITNEAGTIPEELIESQEGKIDIAYSSNVFQHLSVNQREAYYRDIFKMLHSGGMLIVNQLAQSSDVKPTRGFFDEEGNSYLGHYGQFTRVQSQPEIGKALEAVGFQIHSSAITYYNSMMTFAAFKVPPKREEPK